ncbi:GumC family protein [Pseudoalteromonas sp. G4]|uniref:GumC family protein n=1 Tax=Pseudoalteromonas sp. G4 TaxID=2992761 RepID=UPI00237E649E|nr:polysaccharide biosynthesis tyrosine autokinase [Pseudoalteromonas sp. G4]MDE3270658.1 polysaccharide biosynthesis tyrosine autokinase [Pseudoalteromonas sp. G4]
MEQNIQNQQEEIIDLKQYFAVINKAKWRLLTFAFFMTIFAVIVVLKITPTYKATATLLIEAQEAKAVSFEEVYGLDSSKKEYYLTQFEILKSNTIAKQVIEKLNLAEHPEFNKPPSFTSELKKDIKAAIPFLPKKEKVLLSDEELAEKRMLALVQAFSTRLSISPIRKTQMVNISFESEDPKLAALVANTVGEVYIENHMNAKMGITQKAAGWLTDRLSDLRIKLDKSEANLQAYREQENLIDVEGVVGLIKRELEQTSQQLVVSRNDQNKLESITRVIAEYGKSDYERLESIPEITSHKVIQDVKREVILAERKVSELAEVYGPKHPKMIAANAELATVKANLTKQVKALVTGIEKEMRTANANVIALEQDLERIRSQYQKITRKETEYHKLKREVETNRNIYDAFLSRSKETEVTSDFNSAVARFTDRAYAPSLPVKPKKGLIIALVFVASLGFGVVLAFVFEALNDTVKSSSDIENKLTQRMLGLLPLQVLKKKEKLDSHIFFNEEAKQFSEAVRTFRTGFILSQMDKPNKIIEVTSSVPGEGKTTTSSNLAFSLAQMEKVLLIDADMRKPSLCRRFNIPAYHPGLANFIAGTEKFEDCLYTDEKSGLTIMPCGQVPPNPLELLASKRFGKMLEELRTRFDKIVIDTAPTQAVSDSLVISQHADSVIYVVKADSTRMGMVKTGLGRLIEAKANIAGVVLNQVDLKKADSYGSYHGYYDYYGYGEETKS